MTSSTVLQQESEHETSPESRSNRAHEYLLAIFLQTPPPQLTTCKDIYRQLAHWCQVAPRLGFITFNFRLVGKSSWSATTSLQSRRNPTSIWCAEKVKSRFFLPPQTYAFQSHLRHHLITSSKYQSTSIVASSNQVLQRAGHYSLLSYRLDPAVPTIPLLVFLHRSSSIQLRNPRPTLQFFLSVSI